MSGNQARSEIEEEWELCVKVLTKLVSVKDKKQRWRKKLLTSRPSLAATYGSSVRGRGKEKNEGEEGGETKGGWRKKWEEENHNGFSESCACFSHHTPHLYYCVTVDLNCFVVYLWKQNTVSHISLTNMKWVCCQTSAWLTSSGTSPKYAGYSRLYPTLFTKHTGKMWSKSSYTAEELVEDGTLPRTPMSRSWSSSAIRG